MTQSKLPEGWLTCKDRQAWREWLEASHQKEEAVWLEIAKAHAREPGLRLSEAVEEALCFGWIDGKLYSVDDQRFIIRMSPRRPGSRWSLINKERALSLMAQGKMTPWGLLAIERAKETGAWQTAYTSRSIPDLPPELEEALKGDPEARKALGEWPRNQQIQAITWVADGRRDKTREARAARILELLKKGERLL